MLEKEVKTTVEKFLKATEEKEILIISHFDTDGITSATIMTQTLKKLDKTFSLKILKNLEDKFIEQIPKNKVILFLDLASGSLEKISEQKIKDVFILDHHEIDSEIPESINIINPHLNENEIISSSGITYLFCKSFSTSFGFIRPSSILISWKIIELACREGNVCEGPR